MLRLSHLTLGVSDIDLSERFYRDVLSLVTERRDDEVIVRWEAFALILTPRPPAGRGKFHLGFRVNSDAEVDAWSQRLRGLGVDMIGGPAGDSGARALFFRDPDDYEFEIYSEG
ncbi:MAG: VOC family protein [Vulcanimicrobiaceae bacterium]